MISFSLTASLLLACSDTDGVSTLDFVPPKELTIPDLSEVDIDAAFTAALAKTATIQLNPAWSANATTLGLRRPTCPDLYVGGPEDGDIDLREADGMSWSDFCGIGSGLSYGGWVYWDGNVNQSGTTDSASGLTINGSRSMMGQGTVKYNNDLLYEFKGEGSDSLYRVIAEGYERWTYSALINATINGIEATGEDQGFRADMYIYATGGDANMFFFCPTIALLEALGS